MVVLAHCNPLPELPPTTVAVAVAVQTTTMERKLLREPVKGGWVVVAAVRMVTELMALQELPTPVVVVVVVTGKLPLVELAARVL
jgi:hypothetical protein